MLGSVSATPTISSVSGSFEHGSSIHIEGSNFGLKNPVNPIKIDYFEEGINEANLDDFQSEWVRYSTYSAKYSSDFSHSGDLSLTNYLAWANNYFLFNETNEVYFLLV